MVLSGAPILEPRNIIHEQPCLSSTCSTRIPKKDSHAAIYGETKETEGIIVGCREGRVSGEFECPRTDLLRVSRQALLAAQSPCISAVFSDIISRKKRTTFKLFVLETTSMTSMHPAYIYTTMTTTSIHDRSQKHPHQRIMPPPEGQRSWSSPRSTPSSREPFGNVHGISPILVEHTEIDGGIHTHPGRDVLCFPNLGSAPLIFSLMRRSIK